MAFEGVPVPGGQAERRSERAPLVVVEQGPVEVCLLYTSDAADE